MHNYLEQYLELSNEQIDRCLATARVCRESRRTRREQNVCPCFCCYVDFQETERAERMEFEHA